jgi:predicted DNA-binding transcriptional regulator YafY
VRADRLVATLLVLQARGRVTAAQLAEELEISERTARRDLDALAMAGVPVYSRPGRGGGWELVGGARTDLTGLTAAEARALFLVTGPSASVTPEVRAALRKLVQALPETFRADAEAAASAVMRDPTMWDRTQAPRPPHLDAIEQAVIDGVQVRLGYADRDGNPTERTVHPLGLVVKGTVWYLVADTDDGMRTFRVGRVRSVAASADAVVRPEGFDLAATWEATLADLDERRHTHRAVVRVEPHAVRWLVGVFGTRADVGEAAPDGQVRVEVAGQSAEQLAMELARFGDHVEVIEPDEVRRHLAELGASLARRYGACGA